MKKYTSVRGDIARLLGLLIDADIALLMEPVVEQGLNSEGKKKLESHHQVCLKLLVHYFVKNSRQ